MGRFMIEGVEITPLKKISVPNGDVYHALKYTESSFRGFGEAYFSTVQSGEIKGWKRHHKMNLNLVVPIGIVRFVLYDDRVNSPSFDQFQSVELSIDKYSRLTVPPLVWLGFQGVGKETNMLLNIADILHDPCESDHRELEEISYNWSI